MTEFQRWEVAARRRRVAPVVLLVAVALVSGALLGRGGGVAPPPDGIVVAEAPEPAVTHTADEAPMLLAGAWERTSVGPLAGRSGATAVGVGDGVMVWGGAGTELRNDGALYSPPADAWRRVSRSPLEPRVHAAGVWSNGNVAILGGRVFGSARSATLRQEPAHDGAAYDLATDTWRALPPLPFPTEAGRVFASGRRLYAVAATARDRPLAVLEAGSAFWRVAEGPPGWRHSRHIAAAQIGRTLLIWPEGDGPAFGVDMPSERWTMISDAQQPATPLDCACELHAGSLPGGLVDVVGYEPGRRRWWRFDMGTTAVSNAVTTESLLYLIGPPTPAQAIDRRTGVVLQLPAAPQGLGLEPVTAWAGDRLFAWGGIRSLRRLFTADGLTFTP